MLHAAIWITAALAIALWSAAAWLFVEAAQRGPGWVERFAAWVAQLPYARWLDDWAPGWQDLLRAVANLLQTVMGSAGAAAPWWPWLLWGAGVGLVLLVAAFFSLVVVLLTPSRGAARNAPRS